MSISRLMNPSFFEQVSNLVFTSTKHAVLKSKKAKLALRSTKTKCTTHTTHVYLVKPFRL